jgi:hypothetical protein
MRVNDEMSVFELQGGCVDYTVEDIQTANAETQAANAEPTKKKKDKVRSAWISFTGRIVAQLVGAIATVALGVMVLHRYNALDSRPPAAAPPYEANSLPVVQPEWGRPAVHVIVLSKEMLALVDADERFRPADRGCPSRLDPAAPSAAHLDSGSILSR